MACSFSFVGFDLGLLGQFAPKEAGFGRVSLEIVKPKVISIDLSSNVDDNLLVLEKLIFTHPQEQNPIEILFSELGNIDVNKYFGFEPIGYQAVVHGTYKGGLFSKQVALTIQQAA